VQKKSLFGVKKIKNILRKQQKSNFGVKKWGKKFFGVKSKSFNVKKCKIFCVKMV